MKQGFTLLELLITIAILAVLTTVIVVAINPAESIKRARDTQRMSDLDNIKTGIILYISEGYTDIGDGTCDNVPTCKSNCCFDTEEEPDVYNCPCAAAGTYDSYDNDGNGWIPIDFTDMSGGAPLSHIPVDPTNSGTNLYSYAASGTDFELNTITESVYYSNTGKNTVMKKDGGNDDDIYEVGTDLTIITP